MKRQLLEISELTSSDVINILEKSQAFSTGKKFQLNANVANLFYENSTRTRLSFEMSAKELGLNSFNLELSTSSELKGEEIIDTIATIGAMGVDVFVLRHSRAFLIHELAGLFGNKYHFINAGDGMHAHPTQALLDMLTIMQAKPNYQDLSIAILGDLKHSRVAKSNLALFNILGIKDIRLVAPETWQLKGNYTKLSSLKEGIDGADIIMCLRVQKERIEQDIDLNSYVNNYCLTEDNLAYAHKDALVMHPGPVNRDIEISSKLVNSQKSLILKQVRNGVHLRKAVFEFLLEPTPHT